MSDYDPLGSGKRPWFGPKRLGYGIGPQTWQGWLLVAVSAAATIGVATATHSSLAALVMLPVVVFAIATGARSR